MNETVAAGDFNLNISVADVFGATFYTFDFDGTFTGPLTVPTNNFEMLNSGQNYMVSITATKTTSYGNFTSDPLTLTLSTSKPAQ